MQDRTESFSLSGLSRTAAAEQSAPWRTKWFSNTPTELCRLFYMQYTWCLFKSKSTIILRRTASGQITLHSFSSSQWVFHSFLKKVLSNTEHTFHYLNQSCCLHSPPPLVQRAALWPWFQSAGWTAAGSPAAAPWSAAPAPAACPETAARKMTTHTAEDQRQFQSETSTHDYKLNICHWFRMIFAERL